LGHAQGGLQNVNGIIKSITYYPRAVSAAQLQALSRL
jgi:hypothetical protein